MRRARIKRKTKETEIEVELNLDGEGRAEVDTPIKFLNHLLSSFAKHACFDLRLRGRGDFPHHLAEDTMIVLAAALDKALGRQLGIERMGHAVVPMDDALVMVAVDLSGRAYSDVEVNFRKRRLDDLSSDMVAHLLQTFALNGRFNLHVKILRGRNDHHKAEAVFKALGVALRRASSILPGRKVSSTKGVVRWSRSR
jgi:imidazoleglycerol-phosphate dehydratase